jgi:hypothetical protein
VVHLETLNPEVPIAPKAGPTVSRGSLSRPSEADTWHAIRLPAFSPIVISKCKKQLPHIPDARSDESFQGLGPTTASGKFRTVRFERDAWRPIECLDVSPIAAMISKVQHCRIPDARCRECPGPGPTPSPKCVQNRQI